MNGWLYRGGRHRIRRVYQHRLRKPAFGFPQITLGENCGVLDSANVSQEKINGSKSRSRPCRSKPLTIETVRLDGPKDEEVLVEIRPWVFAIPMPLPCRGRSEGIFRRFRHEGAGIVRDRSRSVPLRWAIMWFTPECRQANSVYRVKQICVVPYAIRKAGDWPDGSSRFSIGGEPIYHYMGTSTFANFTVVPESARNSRDRAF